jgi:S-DNA-T family DNA segregation ATPase FtsK/SpoIIIE
MFLQINDNQNLQINTHLLIAGSSGSGKSVALHALILSAMKQGYKLALIDPKRVELSFYKNINNLLLPIAKSAEEAENVIQNIYDLMESRYKKMDKLEQRKSNEIPILLVIDEFSELIEQNKKLMQTIERIASLGRACNIHLIMSTQYPIVKYVSNAIKSNSARLCFHCKSKMQYRIILEHYPERSIPIYHGIFQDDSGEETLIKARYYRDEEIKTLCEENQKNGFITNLLKR